MIGLTTMDFVFALTCIDLQMLSRKQNRFFVFARVFEPLGKAYWTL